MKKTRRIQIERLEERNLLAVSAGALPSLPEQTEGTIWYVNTLNDVTSATDNLLSLREAVEAASSGDTITFAENLSGGTIKLTAGHIKITNAITITGLLSSLGTQKITISGNNENRIFYTAVSNGSLTLEHLKLINGNAGVGAPGSAIFNTGNTVINDCYFSGNGTGGHSYGGCIRNEGGSITITNSVMTGNKAYLGGAVSNKSGTITLTDCTITNNSAEKNGGAIYNDGKEPSNKGIVVITNCLISGNKATSGGGIRNFGEMKLINSEITNNTAADTGGAIWNNDAMTIRCCTIAGNIGALCGGIYLDSSDSASLSLDLYNTIVFGNTQTQSSSLSGYRDIYGSASGSYNLSSKTITGDQNIVYTSSTAALFTKPSNGDYSLAENSDAIDAGYNGYAVDAGGSALQYDVDGNTRIVNNVVDIGAYEYQGKPSFDITISNYSGVYDGTAHTVSLTGLLSTDTVYYSTNGSSYTSTVPITFTDAGSGTVYVKVERSGYTPWTGSGIVTITPRQITVTGTTVSDKEYDGTTSAQVNVGTVSGILSKDNVTVTGSGSFPSSQIGTYNVTVRYALTGSGTTNYTAPSSESVQASIVEKLAKKISVMVVVSNSAPTAAEASILPSSITTADTGSVIYTQVWVKNADGSSLGITGGYIDLTYTTPQLNYGTYTPGDLFAEASNLVNSSTAGTLSIYGGCPDIETTDLGVTRWTLLGYNTFSVKSSGTITISAKSPTLNGKETSSLNLTRLTEGTLKSSEIEYNSVTFTAETKLPKLTVPTITYLGSGGGNRHELRWTSVSNAKSYTLQWSTDQSVWNASSVTTDTFNIIDGLSYGSLIYYRLCANGDGIKYDDSPWTEILSLRVCPMDVDSDGLIGPGDYALVSGAWLTDSTSSKWDSRCDIDCDYLVGPGDWSFLMSNWLKTSDDSNLYYPVIRAELPAIGTESADSFFQTGESIFDLW